MKNFNYHINLANYFKEQYLFFDGDKQKQPNVRKCVELPWQQIKAELWDEVNKTLCNLDFIQLKSTAQLTHDLLVDFNSVLDKIKDFKTFLEQGFYNLHNYSSKILDFSYHQAWNYSNSGPVFDYLNTKSKHRLKRLLLQS